MICKLFELQETTGMIKFKNCSPDTKICPDCGGSTCRYMEMIEEPLVENKKFDWILNRKVKIPEGSVLEKSHLGCVLALQLMHPIQDDIWVILMKPRKGGQFDRYVVICGNKESICDYIKKANQVLRDRFNYEGRDLTKDDFSFGGKIL